MWEVKDCSKKENGNFMVVKYKNGIEVDFICATYHYAAEAQERADELNEEHGYESSTK